MEFFIFIQRADDLLGIKHFNGTVANDITCGDRACFILGDFQSLGTGGIKIQLDALQIEHDLGDIFDHVLKGIEFMFCIINTNRADSCSVKA